MADGRTIAFTGASGFTGALAGVWQKRAIRPETLVRDALAISITVQMGGISCSVPKWPPKHRAGPISI